MVRYFSAMFKNVANNLKSIVSENKQRCNRNVKKYLGSILSKNRTPIKQKEDNLSLECQRVLFTPKRSFSIKVTDKQTNDEVECQLLADASECIFQPQLSLSSFLTSEKGQGAKKRRIDEYKQIKQDSGECRSKDILEGVSFLPTPGITPCSCAQIQNVPNFVPGYECYSHIISARGKCASTLIYTFTQTRLIFDPGGHFPEGTSARLEGLQSETLMMAMLTMMI